MVRFIRRAASTSLFKYLLIGGLSFLLDLGLLAFAFQVLKWPLWVATGAGFWGSFFFNYFLQRHFSFNSKGAAFGAVLRYSALLAVNTVAAMGIVEFFQFVGAGFVAGKVVSTVLTTAWNYLIYKHWIFPQGKTSAKASSPEPSDAAQTAGHPTHSTEG